MLRILQKRVTASIFTQSSRLASTGKSDSAEINDNQEEEEISAPRRAERGLNKVTLLGRVGRDPETRGSEEHPALIFPLATNATYRKSNGELMTKTDWHRVCVFKPSLRENVATRINRGDRILIEGSLSYQRYLDDSKREQTVTSVIADNIVFLSRRAVQNDSEGEN
ncbi:single-stranded DNA-binding protein, mitochondrial-like [Physella acuta]|uniref:single-stranded DNA-binding protein, mitochondrial-like n=1 Tax=Physella acuta TaxID=109671 RepID=UPI0027DEA478|nr:single-stranded DNA-binding protein, mitochondrial-like [Physella acuta]